LDVCWHAAVDVAAYGTNELYQWAHWARRLQAQHTTHGVSSERR
jgi:hypothetical protein